MPLDKRRPVQLFTGDDYQLGNTQSGPVLALVPRGGERNYKCCIYGEWGKRPHEKSSQVYQDVVKNIGNAPQGIIFGVLDMKLHDGVVAASLNTQTPLKSYLKVILYGPGGTPVSIMAPQTPRTPTNIFAFALKGAQTHQQQTTQRSARAPPSRSRDTSSRSRRRPEPESEDDSDSYEEAPKYYEPDFGNTTIKHSRSRRGRHVDAEEFLVPEGIVPHNEPWKNEDD